MSREPLGARIDREIDRWQIDRDIAAAQKSAAGHQISPRLIAQSIRAAPDRPPVSAE